jgi:hypothetical protein
VNSASAAAVHEGYAVGLSADGNAVLVGGLGYDVSGIIVAGRRRVDLHRQDQLAVTSALPTRRTEGDGATLQLGLLYVESLAPSCNRQSHIEANEFKRRRIMIGRNQRGSELQAVSSPQRMCPQ